MAIGIWTPVAGSVQRVAFGEPLLRAFADRLRTVALTSGTHMRIRVLGCEPVYYLTSAPANDAAGLLGIPVYPCSDFVFPYSANIWLYSPYEAGVVQVDTGALT